MTINHPEDDLQIEIVEILRARISSEVIWFHTPNSSSYRSANEQAKLKSMGVRKGVPDLVFMWMHTPGVPVTAWIELKSPDGKVSDDQSKFLHQAKEMGHACALARSVAEVMHLLDLWKVPLKQENVYEPEFVKPPISNPTLFGRRPIPVYPAKTKEPELQDNQTKEHKFVMRPGYQKTGFGFPRRA